MPRRRLIGFIVLLGATLAARFSVTSARQERVPPAQCFRGVPGVAECLEGRFAQYWEDSGGLMVFGYPTTPLYDAGTRDGLYLAQMVERNRLEYHPELAPPYDILLGRLGEDLLTQQGRDWRAEPAGFPSTGCLWFEVTRHAVCDQEPGRGFLSYYRAHGLELGDRGISQRESLALFGLPLTEPQMETNAAGDTVLTQWFERARFEWHPDNPDQFKVLLGLLGNEAWGTAALPPPSDQSAPPAIGQTAPSPTRTRVPLTATPTATTALPILPGETSEPTRTTTETEVPTEFTSTPTLTPTRVPTTSGTPDDAALLQRLYDLALQHHLAAGCPAWTHDPRLDRAAQLHAEDIAAHKRIDHVGTDGARIKERLARQGYSANRATESIAVYRSPEEAVERWMDEGPDGPHRRNITNCQYVDAGVGLAYDSRGWKWWVMDYASPAP